MNAQGSGCVACNFGNLPCRWIPGDKYISTAWGGPAMMEVNINIMGTFEDFKVITRALESLRDSGARVQHLKLTSVT